MRILLLLLILAVVFLLWVRFAPDTPAFWHKDPNDAEARRHSARLLGADAPVFNADPAAVLDALKTVALAEEGVDVSTETDGMITFITRTKLVRYRDYVTAKAVAMGDQTRLELYARPALNVYDWGVNEARLGRWIGQLEQTLGR